MFYSEGLKRVDIFPLVRDVLRTNVSNRTDLQIVKRASYRRLYGELPNTEFNKKVFSISYSKVLDQIHNKTYYDMMDAFVLNSIQKNLNISFREFMSMPIDEVLKLINYSIKLNKRLLELRKEGVSHENDDLY